MGQTLEEKPLEERLVNGAKVLAKIHREREVAPCGWHLGCQCEPPATKRWCMAKQRWVTLAMEEKRQVGNSGPFGLIEVMKTPEIDAAGITCTVEMPEGRIDVGPQGQISWKHLQALTQNVEEAKSLFRVMANFRGSIIGITEKEEKPDGAAQNEE